jgi:ADP-ribose 1''-phosphate phosphatase
MITYRKMSLFDAPKGSYLVHACNTQGYWGEGIDLQFKNRFPHSYAVYSRGCQGNSKFALGKVWVIRDSGYSVGCLLTSEGYGYDRSSKEEILKNTEPALRSLLNYISEWDKKAKVIHSNRFNAGRLGVPWEETEQILQKVLKEYSMDWIVCDLI